MPETLLHTKLFVPPLRPNLVPRPQLIERLNQGLEQGHRLILVSAPAGFGKTTLVNAWAQQTEQPIAWLSLDENDNDPMRFLAYLIAALDQVEGIEAIIGRAALDMLHSPQPPPVESVLTSLINDVTAVSEGLIFILDDYHLIDSSPVHDALTFLLEHLPSQLHLVIATRADPHLPLSRLRARGHLTDLRGTDLRFTDSEATAFLNQVMGLTLSEEDIKMLESRTEGWIAGLQLAAISLQGRDDSTKLIESFSGSHRFVLDYLLEEVLEQQTETVQTFLLQTAVLDRLTSGLCDAVCFNAAELPGSYSGRTTTGQETLEALEHANLFVVPLDEERRWYRYHHLFSDLLRRRLRQKYPEWTPVLHARAGEWYRRNGFVDKAVEHTLIAGEVDRAAGMIEENADTLWMQGEHVKLHRWLAQLPHDLILSRPQLAVFHAWDKFAAGQQDAAERTLRAVEQALDLYNATSPNVLQLEALTPASLGRKNLRGRVSAIRAFMASHRSEVTETIEHSRRALDDLPMEALSWRSAAAIALGDAYVFRGDYHAAHQARLEALETSRAASNSYLFMNVSLKFALNLRAQGKLMQTIEVCEDRLDFANEHGMARTDMVGWLLAIWGEVLAEINELDEALKLVRSGVELTEGGRDVAMLGWSYCCLTRILFSRGEFDAAAETISKTEDVARDHVVPPWIMKLMAAWQVRLWLAQNRLEDAAEWVRERGLDSGRPATHVDALEYIALARVLICQQATDEAIGMLERLLKPAEAGGHDTRVIELLILQALALRTNGDKAQSMIKLEKVLTLAKPREFVRIFVDEGPPMANLLYEALNREIAPDYVRQLLAAFSINEPVQIDPSESEVSQYDYVEPLSEREIEVLELIAQGLTNLQIADRLFLSLHTVKAHTRNIYGKLAVHNRTEAVAKAKVLGILPNT